MSRIGLISKNKQKSDRRSNRTENALGEAFVALLLRRHYDLITVQNIIDEADVGRSTFYAHFQSKEDLLTKNFERVVELITERVSNNHDNGKTLISVTALFQHADEFRQIYQALARAGKAEILFTKAQKHLNDELEKKPVVLDNNRTTLPLPIFVNHLTGTLFNLLKWRLDHDSTETPERMDKIYQELTAHLFSQSDNQNP